MSNPLAEAARSARLEVCGRIVDRYEPGVPLQLRQTIVCDKMPRVGLRRYLGQLTRRGLQPSLVAALRANGRNVRSSAACWPGTR